MYSKQFLLFVLLDNRNSLKIWSIPRPFLNRRRVEPGVREPMVTKFRFTVLSLRFILSGCSPSSGRYFIYGIYTRPPKSNLLVHMVGILSKFRRSLARAAMQQFSITAFSLFDVFWNCFNGKETFQMHAIQGSQGSLKELRV